MKPRRMRSGVADAPVHRAVELAPRLALGDEAQLLDLRVADRSARAGRRPARARAPARAPPAPSRARPSRPSTRPGAPRAARRASRSSARRCALIRAIEPSPSRLPERACPGDRARAGCGPRRAARAARRRGRCCRGAQCRHTTVSPRDRSGGFSGRVVAPTWRTKVAIPSTWTYFSGTERAYPLLARSVKVWRCHGGVSGARARSSRCTAARSCARSPGPPGPSTASPSARRSCACSRAASWGGFPSPNTEARAFGQEFARFIGAEHAVPCANGTFSLMLALQAARVPPGSEVITSAYTFVGTAGGILAAGCIPVLADVDPETYCVDPGAAAAARTREHGGAHARAPRLRAGRHGRARRARRAARPGGDRGLRARARRALARPRRRGARHRRLVLDAELEAAHRRRRRRGHRQRPRRRRAARVAGELRAQGAGRRRVPRADARPQPAHDRVAGGGAARAARAPARAERAPREEPGPLRDASSPRFPACARCAATRASPRAPPTSSCCATTAASSPTSRATTRSWRCAPRGFPARASSTRPSPRTRCSRATRSRTWRHAWVSRTTRPPSRTRGAPPSRSRSGCRTSCSSAATARSTTCSPGWRRSRPAPPSSAHRPPHGPVSRR